MDKTELASTGKYSPYSQTWKKVGGKNGRFKGSVCTSCVQENKINLTETQAALRSLIHSRLLYLIRQMSEMNHFIQKLNLKAYIYFWFFSVLLT